MKELTRDECKELFDSLNFGDTVINHWASEDNPHRIGVFVKRCNYGGHRSIEVTDKKGNFWHFHYTRGLKITAKASEPSGGEEREFRLLFNKMRKSLIYCRALLVHEKYAFSKDVTALLQEIDRKIF